VSTKPAESGAPHQLLSYLPSRLVGRLAARGVPAQPGADAFEAAALFTDLTGFTALAERLSRQGPRGAERLTEILEQVFGLLIDRVLDWGGDIVTFAGDAILAAWPIEGDDGGADAVTAAVGCALACRDAIHAMAALPEGELRLRSGVGVGGYTLSDVGGRAGRWAHVSAGGALIATGAAEKAAGSGDVFVCERAHRLVRDRFDVERTPGGWRAVRAAHDVVAPGAPADPGAPGDPPSPSAAAVRAYLPPAVLSQVDAGQTRWMAELRPVSSVFLRIKGLDPSDPAAGATLQALVVRVQELLDRWEGTLNKLLCDDLGTTLVIGYGFPPHAHEDDSVRAVRTAIRLADHCRTEGLPFGIGVATGRAFCGAYGSDRRREYTMLGPSVNLAARLMGHAQDDVLCDPPTVRHALQRLSFQELDPVDVRGVAEPVPVARPVAERGLSGRHEVLLTGRDDTLSGALASLSGSGGSSGNYSNPPDRSVDASSSPVGFETIGTGGVAPVEVVGRLEEKELLRRRLDQLVNGGRKGAVVIEAEAGYGKSLLGAWLHGEALESLTSPLLGACEPTTRNDAWHPWRQVFIDLVGLEDLSDPELLAEWARQRLDGDERLEAWIPLLGDLLPTDLPDNETTANMTGGRRADALGELLAALLAAETRARPQLILLEDVHWMDPSSWAFVSVVLRLVDRILLVLLTRPMGSQAPRELTLLLEREDCDHQVLDRLAPSEVTDLVCQLLHVEGLPEPVAGAITGRAEGNPFYAQELAHALLESGAIRVADRTCHVDSPDLTLHLPDTLQGAVTSRLDTLDPRHGLTAKVASVIGRSFGRDVLSEVHPQAEARPELPDHLTALSDAGIAEADGGDDEAPWTFLHVIIQEAAYALLPYAQRRELHAEVAGWYAAHPDDAATVGPVLAWHYRQAEQHGDAVDALEAAGAAAAARGAYAEGLTLLDEALEVDRLLVAEGGATSPARVAEWHKLRADCLMSRGDFAGSKATYELALAQLGLPLPTSKLGWAWWLLREVTNQVAHRVLPDFMRRRVAGPAEARMRQAALIYAAWAAVAYFTIEPLHWFIGGVTAINIADRVGDDQVSGQALGAFGNVVGALKLQRAARYYLKRSEGITDSRNRTVCHWSEAVFDLTYCRWEASRRVATEGIELCERTADRYSIGLGYTIRGLDSLLVGRLQDCVEDNARTLVVARLVGNTEHESWSLSFGAPALLALGRTEQLAADLTAMEGLVPVLDPFTHVGFHGVRAQARARDGDYVGALEDAAEMVRLYGQHPLALFTHLPGFAGGSEAVLAAVEAVTGGAEVAVPEGWTLAKLDKKVAGLMTAGAFSYVYFRPRKHLLAGTRAHLASKAGAARKAWRKAAALADKLAMPYERALVSLEQARLLPAGSAEARAALDDARERLTALGAAGDLKRLQALANR